MSTTFPASPETLESVASQQQKVVTSPSIKRGEVRVLLLILGVFVGLEIFFRVGGNFLSKDIAHLKAIPATASALGAATDENETKVLFLGNSLTRYAIQPRLFEEEVALAGHSIQAWKVNPDNTALADWFSIFQTHFERTNNVPEVLIIGFEGGHLRDADTQHPDRLARYYSDWCDIPELFETQIRSFEEQALFLCCKVSAACGNRDRIQRRLLDKLIPGYRSGMDDLNARMNRANSSQSESSEPSYQRLLNLIAMAERKQVQVILAAIAVPQHYEFDTQLLEVVDSTSAILLDGRDIEELNDAMFFDGLHMDEEAGTIYTKTLAQKAIPHLRPLPLEPGELYPQVPIVEIEK